MTQLSVSNYDQIKSMSFTMNDVEFTTDKKTIYFKYLLDCFDDCSDKARESFLSSYSSFYSVEDILRNSERAFDKAVAPYIAKALNLLIDSGIYSMTDQSVFNGVAEESGAYDSFVDVLEALSDKLSEIDDQYHKEVNYRKYRKATRSRMVGGGFGFSGAIKGMATAGAYNMTTGALHSAVNTVGNIGSAIGKSVSKTALLYDSTIKNGLADSVEYFVNCIPAYVFIRVTGARSTPDIVEAARIYHNLSQVSITSTQRKQMYSQMFSIWPFDKSIYVSFLQDYDDPKGEVSIAARAFGIILDDSKLDILLKRCENPVIQVEYFDDTSRNMLSHITEANEAIKKINKMAEKLSLNSSLIGSTVMIKTSKNELISYNQLLDRCLYIDGVKYHSFTDAREAAEKWDILVKLFDYSESKECQITDFDDRSHNLEMRIKKAMAALKAIDNYAASLNIPKARYENRVKLKCDDLNTYFYNDVVRKCHTVDKNQYSDINKALEAAHQWDILHSKFKKVSAHNYESVMEVTADISAFEYSGPGKKHFLDELKRYDEKLRTVNGLLLDTFEEAEEARKQVAQSAEYIARKYGHIDFKLYTITNRSAVMRSEYEIQKKFGAFFDTEWTKKCNEYYAACDKIEHINITGERLKIIIITELIILIITAMLTFRMFINLAFVIIAAVFIAISVVFIALSAVKAAKWEKYYKPCRKNKHMKAKEVI